jgi:ABC-2 type transport system permease protein
MEMNGKSTFSQLLASVLVNAVYAMINYPIMIVNTLLAPLSILVVITFVSHGALVGVGIEGALIMTMVSGGIGLQGDLSHLKNDFKMQDMVVSSPTSSLTYVAGMALSELVFSLPVLALLSVLAAVYLHPTLLQTGIIIAVMSLMFIFSIVLGFLLSTFTSDIVQSWGFSGIVSVLLSTIPPVYYLITYIPLPFRYIAYISPTTYAAEIIQNAMGFLQISSINLVADWIVVIAATICLMYLSYKKARWREP